MAASDPNVVDPAADLTPVYEDAGKQYGIDPDLLRAQTHVESSDNDYAVSPAGAEGRSQFIPSTARRMGLQDPFDPRESIPAQARLLRENMDRFGSPEMSIAAYHGGENTSAWGDKTRDYLNKVVNEYGRRKAAAPPPPPSVPAFDPSQPFHVEQEAPPPAFDPSKPFKVEEGRPLSNREAVKQSPMAQRDEPAESAARKPFVLPSQSGQTDQAAPSLGPLHSKPDAGTDAFMRIYGAAGEGYKDTPPILTERAQAFADKWGLGGDARALGSILAGMNAAFKGAQQTAYEIGSGLGGPALGRDLAGMGEAFPLGGHELGVHFMPRAPEGEIPNVTVRPERPAAEGVATPTPETPAPPPAAPAEAPVAHPTMEQSALAELDPETHAAASAGHQTLAQIAKEEGVDLAPMPKAVERESPPEPAAEAGIPAEEAPNPAIGNHPQEAAEPEPAAVTEAQTPAPGASEEPPIAEPPAPVQAEAEPAPAFDPSQPFEVEHAAPEPTPSQAPPRLAPAIKITDSRGQDRVYTGQVGELHMHVASDLDPKLFQTARETDLGFADPVTGRYYTRDEALAAIGHAEASQMNAARAAPEPTREEPPQPAPVQRGATPFDVVPKEPERLSSFLRRIGGVKDEGGDIRSSLGGSRFRPGLINNKSGIGMDEAALKAWEAGYFPELGDERPTINNLRDALDDDVKGRARYSHQDEGAVEAYSEATERNAELDRLATEHGIATKGKTHEQFYDELHDKLSGDEVAREMQSQADAHEAAYREAEQAAKQWVDEHPGEKWHSKDFYANSQARTLKDLEDEHQQETAATAARERGSSGEEPGTAGGDQEPVPEGGGTRGGGAGAGRGAEAADHTANGARPSRPVASWVVVDRATDKAVAETYEKKTADAVNLGKYKVVPIQDYLSNLNSKTGMVAPDVAEMKAPIDLLGRPVAEARAARTPEPTIRNDTRQETLGGTEPSAVQAQAARDAQGRGALQTDVAQKPADEGLFAPDTSGQGTLYSGGVFDPAAWRRMFSPLPGAKSLAPHEILREKQGLSRALAEIKAGLAPTSLRGAKPMEYAIRRHTAESAQAYDHAYHQLDKVRAAIDGLSKQEQIEFTDRMETGQRQPNPALQQVADTLRGALDQWAGKVRGLGRGYLANAMENYMGHIWGNYREWVANKATTMPQTQMQTGAIAGNVRRQPLRGSGSFLKQRSFPTQLEGINAGLVPVTFNPVDLQMIKIHEMQKFYHGTVLADQIKAQKLAKWVSDADAHDALNQGMVKLDDRIFQPKLYGVTPVGPVEPGAWYAAEPMARVFNNYMSQGWHGQSSIYDAMRRGNNALNSLQLGFSGFHAAFVTSDTAISKVALGLQQIATGHPVKGTGNVLFGTAGFPAAVVQTVRRGSQMRKAWLDPAGATPEMQRIIDAFKAGGGRMEMPDFFKTSNSGTFFRSLTDLKNPAGALHQAAQMFRDAPTVFQKGVMTPLRLAGRVIDTINQPLMGAMVPRAKMGVFADLAQNWLRDNPTASAEEVAAAMTKFQDSVDNRLGQLNYDNLFWNKVAKDIAFVSTRSVGWNLGTLREIGGAFVDSGSALKAIGQGKAPQLTTRMAYTIALPIVTAEIGAIMTYLSTGQAPQSLLDYFYPPTGLDEDGNAVDRRSIPGYMKDLIAFWHDPGQTALNKTAPLPESIQELAKNRDYYGGVIYDPERDSAAPAYGDFLLNQTTPFTLRSWNKLHGEGAPLLDQAMAFWGFQPAPKSITQPERGEMFQRRDQKRAYKAREKEVSKGQTIRMFNSPPAASP